MSESVKSFHKETLCTHFHKLRIAHMDDFFLTHRKLVASFIFVLTAFLNYDGLNISLSAQAQTLDDSLKQEIVGRALFRPNTNQFVFEKRRGYENLPPDSFRNPVRAIRFTSILTAKIDGRGKARALFRTDSKATYKLASFSPDGSRLLFSVADESEVRIGAYDFTEGKPRYYDIVVHDMPFIGFEHGWLDEETVVFISNPPGAGWQVPDGISGGFEALQASRKAAWANERASADVIGGGRYADLTVQPRQRRLVRLNLRTGRTDIIGSGDFTRVVVSPDKKRVAVTAVSERLVPPTEFSPMLSLKGFRAFDLTVYDLEGGGSVTPCQSCDVSGRAVYWSPSGRQVLFYSRAKGERDGYFYKYDAVDNALTRLSDTLVLETNPNSGWRWVENKRSAGWIGETPIILESPAGQLRKDWFAVLDNGERRNLTASFDGQPPELVLATADNAVFLHDGMLHRITPEGAATPMSSGEDAPVLQAIRESRGVRQRVFTVRNGVQPGKPSFLRCFDKGYAVGGRIPYDGDHMRVMGVSPDSCAVVYARFSYDGESRVILKAEGSSAQGRKLLSFNNHLKGKDFRRNARRLSHVDDSGEEIHHWLFLPPAASSEPGRNFPLIVIPYTLTSYGKTQPEAGYASPPWALNPTIPVSIGLFNERGYAVLLPSIPNRYAEYAAERTTVDMMLKSVPYVMRAVEDAIGTGYIDETRMALSGHSSGGRLVQFLATQTDAFKAVVSTAAPVNNISFYGTIGPPHLFGRSRIIHWAHISEMSGSFNAPPWDDPDRYLRNSPIVHIDNVNTPIMLIHGDLDPVNISQSEEAFSALYRQNKDVVFVRYWGEQHSIHSPVNIRDMWARVFAFLEEHGAAPSD